MNPTTPNTLLVSMAAIIANQAIWSLDASAVGNAGTVYVQWDGETRYSIAVLKDSRGDSAAMRYTVLKNAVQLANRFHDHGLPKANPTLRPLHFTITRQSLPRGYLQIEGTAMAELTTGLESKFVSPFPGDASEFIYALRTQLLGRLCTAFNQIVYLPEVH